VVEKHAIARLTTTERFLRSLLVTDVPGDRGCAHHLASGVERRQRQRYVPHRAVLGKAARLVSRHGLAARDTFEQACLLAFEFLRDHQRDGPPDGFLGRPSVQSLGTSVPARDDAVQVLREHRVLCRLDDRGELDRALIVSTGRRRRRLTHAAY
jgi:hypothetical protein